MPERIIVTQEIHQLFLELLAEYKGNEESLISDYAHDYYLALFHDDNPEKISSCFQPLWKKCIGVDVLSALFYGHYIIELSPHEKVQEMYKAAVKEEATTDNSSIMQGHGLRKYMQGIVDTLNALDIEVSGVNAPSNPDKTS